MNWEYLMFPILRTAYEQRKRLRRGSRKTAAQNASQRLGAAFDLLGKARVIQCCDKPEAFFEA